MYETKCIRFFQHSTTLLNISKGDHYWENKKSQTLVQLNNTLIIAITEK